VYVQAEQKLQAKKFALGLLAHQRLKHERLEMSFKWLKHFSVALQFNLTSCGRYTKHPTPIGVAHTLASGNCSGSAAAAACLLPLPPTSSEVHRALLHRQRQTAGLGFFQGRA